MKKDFEILPHTADIKLRVYGKTIEELFENAMVGMFQSINPVLKSCCQKDGINFSKCCEETGADFSKYCEKDGVFYSKCDNIIDRLECDNLPIVQKIELYSIDYEALLVNFLSEALYLSDFNNQAYLKAKVKIEKDTMLEDGRFGVKIFADIYGIEVVRFAVEIKAVTYNELKIEFKDGFWQTNIVFDI